ncbi:hypothetical protein F5X99DRAFT_188723 [Biscogniauxia marginata]|nr:hypothetical protein F5X99DRAFT_188723 [Biscogniauxia marginata]
MHGWRTTLRDTTHNTRCLLSDLIIKSWVSYCFLRARRGYSFWVVDSTDRGGGQRVTISNGILGPLGKRCWQEKAVCSFFLFFSLVGRMGGQVKPTACGDLPRQYTLPTSLICTRYISEDQGCTASLLALNRRTSQVPVLLFGVCTSQFLC